MRYRPDIDGLRAIAVLSVVLFHAGIQSVSGGYSGVDVFFVISGFLITSILAKEISQGDFSLIAFYERRVRRIFPALFAVIIFTSIAAYFLLLPRDFESYGKSLIAVALSVSNIKFWKEAGYFDSAAELKPLLHTWSLGIEEQFYLVFPLFLLLISRYFKQRWVIWTGAVAAISFFANVWLIERQPSAVFYLAQTRAWELAVGALLALGAFPSVCDRYIREIIAFIGLGLIAWGIVVLDAKSSFPGFNALFPCVGAVMVIHAGSSGPTLVGHVLSLRPLVLIGLISYSFYLWHWPLLAFFRYYMVRPLSGAESLSAVLAAFILAIMSWHFIERPFRKKKKLIGRSMVFAGGIALLLVAIVFGALTMRAKGWPGRIPEEVMRMADGVSDVSTAAIACMNANKKLLDGEATCSIGADVGTPSFVVFGDSHAGALVHGIDILAKRYGEKGVNAAIPACPPLDGVTIRFSLFEKNCEQFRSRMLSSVESAPTIRTIVLVARWPVYAEGVWYGHESGGKIILTDEENQHSGNREVFVAGLERTVARLRKANKRVFIVFSVPEIGWDVPSVAARGIYFGNSIDIRPTIEDYVARNRNSLKSIKRLSEKYGASVIYPHTLLCADGHCLTSIGGKSLYSDDDHLSVLGAERISNVFEPIFVRSE